ncbi:hypothetical protein [Marinobacter sediminum]|uniref:AbiTii domain-containing protein n=1 Tax=Marinobacter sediminum TaxID=256323 RepID=UPI00193A73F2|nr:hypothetical protein [Marinobacter sediminum]
MSASVNHLEERTKDPSELLGHILPSAIALALMLRHKKMAAWLRAEFEGYQDRDQTPPYRRDLPGHIVARSPQYGWIPAPVNETQKKEFGHLDVIDDAKSMEKVCLTSRKGDGNRVLLTQDDMAVLQQQINLSAELAINLSRDVYSRLLRTVRGTVYLWTQELMARGLSGDHNHYSQDERALVTDLDDPERFWRRAMEEVDDLPVADVKPAGFFERVFGRAS